MAAAQIQAAIEDVAPDFLSHLELAFGWTEEQALDALGAYVMSTEAGRALRRQLDFVDVTERSKRQREPISFSRRLPERVR